MMDQVSPKRMGWRHDTTLGIGKPHHDSGHGVIAFLDQVAYKAFIALAKQLQFVSTFNGKQTSK